MSELIDTGRGRRMYRRHLMITVSIAVLASASTGAFAEDTDRPTVWIELGGQLEGLDDSQEAFAPSFLTGIAQYGIKSPLGVEKPSHYGFATEGSISFAPDDSDWVFSASVHYGRWTRNKSSHQQTPNAHLPVHFTFNGKYYHPTGSKYPSSHVKFADAAAKQSESHGILDFQAGKDLGLGLFGARGSSVLSSGIRFAQFSSKSNISMHMEPDLHYPTQPLYSLPAIRAFRSAAIHFHDDAATETSQRSFRGIGPSIAWNASAPFVGNSDRGELTLDWGANAAILFGRQKVHGHHQTTVRSYYKQGYDGGRQKVGLIQHAFATVSVTQHSHATAFGRARSVIVPDLGGFAGLSYLYADAKISFGYRADFFFGAMDGGINTAKKENLGFYGPFAAISLGLGG